MLARDFVILIVFSAAALASPRGQPAVLRSLYQAPPKVSSEFQAEITRLAGEGLRLKEALEVSLDADSRHLAAIFERANAKPEELARFEFRIIESAGRAARTIFRRPEFYFSFPDARQVGRLNGTDINRDALKEVFVESSSGGNCWACNPIEIYQIRNRRVELIAAGPIQDITDLNGDGVFDLVVTDTRWEGYDDFSHVASPAARMIYTWRGGRYVYASPDFAAFYRKEIEELRASIEEAKARITTDQLSDEEYVGRAVSLAITYAHSGDVTRGLKELETLLESNAKSAEQRKHRGEILEDFRRGDSAKSLREIKPGDPLPLG